MSGVRTTAPPAVAIANPAALGLGGFALTMFVLSPLGRHPDGCRRLVHILRNHREQPTRQGRAAGRRSALAVTGVVGKEVKRI
jgi:hypothetical protein